MEEKLLVTRTLTLNAPVETVWRALIDPEQTKQYLYNCRVVADWKEGETVHWVGEQDGQETVFVKGYVVDVVPPHRLEYSVFDPNMAIEDVSDNYLTIAYELEDADGQTTLSVTQGDFAQVANGEKRYKDADAGWDYALDGLKKLIEA